MTYTDNYLSFGAFQKMKEGTMDVYLGSHRYRDAKVGDELLFREGDEELRAVIVAVTHCDDYWGIPYDKIRMGYGRCEIFNPDFYDNYTTKELGGLYLLEFSLVE